MSLDKHVTSTCKVCFFHLRNISKIRDCLSPADTEKLVHAFTTSKLEIAYSEARKAKAIKRAEMSSLPDFHKNQDLVNGLSITKVILSRFLRDHCLGARRFTAVPILSLKKVDNGEYLGSSPCKKNSIKNSCGLSCFAIS